MSSEIERGRSAAGEALTNIGDDFPQTLGNACEDPQNEEDERDLRDWPYAAKKRRTLIHFIRLVRGKIAHAAILAIFTRRRSACLPNKRHFNERFRRTRNSYVLREPDQMTDFSARDVLTTRALSGALAVGDQSLRLDKQRL